jgi:hypothetical protein
MANALATPALAPGPPQHIDALPVTVNLSLYAGDDFWLDLAVTNPDGTEADLTDMAARAQIRARAGAPEVMATFDVELAGNVISLHLTSTASADLSGNAVWDCQLTDGTVATLAAGRVKFTPQVSRP